MALEWQVLIMSLAALSLRILAYRNRAKADGAKDGPKTLGRSAEYGPQTFERIVGQKS